MPIDIIHIYRKIIGDCETGVSHMGLHIWVFAYGHCTADIRSIIDILFCNCFNGFQYKFEKIYRT